MDAAFYQEHSKWVQAVGSELIAATPETWSRAQLTLTPTMDAGRVALAQEISNPDGLRDLVRPTEELIETSARFHAFCEAHGDRWERCDLLVYEVEGSWQFNVNFKRGS
nr:hypothetical protein [Dyella sp. ASV24]